MTPTEAASLLTIAAAFDNRKPDADAATAWALALDGLRFEDCRAVIVAHYQASREWLMPSDVRTGVKRLRAARLSDAVFDPPPGADPDNVAGYLRWLADQRRLRADGEVFDEPVTPDLPARDVIAELGQAGRANEIPSAEIRTNADRLRAEARAGRMEWSAAQKPEPEPLPELTDDDQLRAQLGGKPDLPPEDRVGGDETSDEEVAV